ncbi:period circadian protein [Holotrichia oblita]|uniref:Period circadian protein n=1 Tax=Holotrichia oblita TaxID=644536 RepID=A0ACB9TE08_HOLOL|nr:period circadian protein [Holotrichia oblita]
MSSCDTLSVIMKISADNSELDWTSSDSNVSEVFSSSKSTSSNDSDLVKPPKRKLHRITTFMDTVREYDEQEFEEHFRLSRLTVDIIINMVELEHILPQHKFVQCIVAAAVLHNICLDNKDDVEFDIDDNNAEDNENINTVGVSGINEKYSKRDDFLGKCLFK